MIARWFGGAAALVCLAAVAHAAPYTAAISVDLAELRAGPSASYPVTGAVRRGESVRVVGESNGWLAIEPPPGSRSYVCGRFVMFHKDTQPGAGTVGVVQLQHGTPVRAGSSEKRGPFDVETARLPLGSQVRIIGPAISVEGDGQWWPIEPVPGERRYLPPGSVGPSDGSVPVESARGPGTPSVAGSSPAIDAGPPRSAEELWNLASQADRAGNSTEARRLYELLARRVDQPGEAEYAARALNRISQLDFYLKPRDVPLATASRPTPGPAPGVTASRTVPGPAPTPAATPTNPAGAKTVSARGYLRPSPVKVQDRPAFALEGGPSGERYYIVAGPGVQLDYYRSLLVDVTGQAWYDGEKRASCLIAESVRPVK